MAGTDHPFFPPMNPGGQGWLSVTMNYDAVSAAFGDSAEAKGILGGNAVKLLRLEL